MRKTTPDILIAALNVSEGYSGAEYLYINRFGRYDIFRFFI